MRYRGIDQLSEAVSIDCGSERATKALEHGVIRTLALVRFKKASGYDTHAVNYSLLKD